MSFTHLHVASAFSAHYGVDWPDALAAEAKAEGAWALAATDRDGLYGLVKHVGACLGAGLAPIAGVDLALLPERGHRRGAPPAREEASRGARTASATHAPGGRSKPSGRVVILARGAGAQSGLGTRFLPAGRAGTPRPAPAGAGYAALCSLVSLAHAGASPHDGGLAPVRDLSPEARHTRRPRPGAVGPSPDPQVSVGVTPTQLASLVRAPGGAPALTVLLGPDSDVGRAAAARDYRGARVALRAWKEALGPGALAVEVVSHYAEPGAPYSMAHAVRMLRIARELGVPAVLSNAVRYLHPDGAATADVLDAVRLLSPLSLGLTPPHPGEALQANGQGWLKPARDMHALAAELAYELGAGNEAAIELLRDTEDLAAASALDPLADLGWGVPSVPEASVLGLSGDPQEILRARCEEGLERHFGPGAPGSAFGKAGRPGARERLEHELGIIADLGFAGYFLTVATATDLIRSLGVRSAARGSGASSLVAYLTGISHVNPLAHDLIFERFLSRDRTSLPDIDVDVESARRHEVYRELFRRFGSERTTLMSMQNAYRARGAVRDAGMALGLEGEETDAIAKSLWRFSAGSFREAIDAMPELRPLAQRLEADRAKGGHQVDLLVDLTERLDRLPRHISMHPCGVILSDARLLTRTPVQASGLGLPMSQFDKHDMDPMGLLKLDVLGVRMQSTIAYTLEEIARIHGDGAAVHAAGQHERVSMGAWYEGRKEYSGVVRRVPDGAGAPDGLTLPGAAPTPSGTSLPPWLGQDGVIDLSLVPLDDEATYEMIRTTNTLGVFQIESPGQRELIGKLAPTEFNDLIIDISLFRPGPMQSDMVRPFLEQRHGFAEEAYPHPDLAPILAETHGVVVFHEQVLRMLDVMTGCGLAQADVLRRRLGNPAKEPAVERFFRAETLKRGYPLPIIDRVWATLAAFGSFGFCKAHGAAFAVPTYHSAWLKTHHPEAFLAGLFEHDPGMYPRRLLIAEARRLGVPLLPLDVNHSGRRFAVEEIPGAPGVEAVPGVRASGKLGVRLALSLITSLSEAEAVRLEAGAPYDSVADVRDRARPTRTNLRRLAQLGALDRFLVKGAGGRADLVHHLDAQREGLMNGVGARRGAGASGSRKVVRRQVDGQLALPLGVDLETSALTPLFPEPTPTQRIREELDLTAADLSGHLMSAHHAFLDKVGATPSDRLLTLRSGSRVLVAGVRVATQTPPMRSGERVVFLSLDDGHGCVDIAFFTQAQHATGPLLFASNLMLVEGVTRRTGPRAVSVQALKAWDLQGPNAALPGADYLERTEGEWRAALRRDPELTVPGEAGGWYRGIVRAGVNGATAAELAPAGALAPTRAGSGAAAGRGARRRVAGAVAGRPVPWRPGDGLDATGGGGDGLGALGESRVKKAGGMG
ncbi:DNA polymerase III subunit alpha [Galactobacter valiniphilus]|uniref:DNA polymerase III subunit alpha n=1 Tax=Galactobacter valiniphilus TaxID=2676122 RepID=UPI003735266E